MRNLHRFAPACTALLLLAACGVSPKTYHKPYNQVFEQSVRAAETLRFEVNTQDRGSGRIHALKPKGPYSDASELDIQVTELADGRTQVHAQSPDSDQVKHFFGALQSVMGRP